MRGIILPYRLNNDTEIKIGDLVSDVDEYMYYIVTHLNPRYKKEAQQDDNPYNIFVKNFNSDEELNFCKEELIKLHCGFFDYDKYYRQNKKIFLGHISALDINYIKCKVANDYEYAYSELYKITDDYLLGLSFDGEIKSKEYFEESLPTMPVITKIDYFMINKPS